MSDEDQKSFGALVASFRPRFLRQALLILGNEADAMDVVQNALQQAWARRIHVQGEDAWRSWTSTVVINGAYDLLRRYQAEARKCSNAAWVQALEADPLEPGEHEELWRYADWRDVEENLQYLDAKRRDVFVLKAQGLSYKEMGRRLGMPVGTVGGYLSQARQQLLERLKPLAEMRRNASLKTPPLS